MSWAPSRVSNAQVSAAATTHRPSLQLFSMFGGKMPLRPGTPEPGERPYLIARVGLNRSSAITSPANPAASRLQYPLALPPMLG